MDWLGSGGLQFKRVSTISLQGSESSGYATKRGWSHLLLESGGSNLATKLSKTRSEYLSLSTLSVFHSLAVSAGVPHCTMQWGVFTCLDALICTSILLAITLKSNIANRNDFGMISFPITCCDCCDLDALPLSQIWCSYPPSSHAISTFFLLDPLNSELQ